MKEAKDYTIALICRQRLEQDLDMALYQELLIDSLIENHIWIEEQKKKIKDC